ncbi:Icc protein [Kushneria sinocarnis]|uniref:Icc protein n=1 Tax=Kushneria sinocarnis TaxID=595502 RepID=A0A420WTI0_9GAMM|nr:metallophosphoesterase [Kushneria sinocarnis]RKQ96270.1 Icc protein [Kushneria sinocarnis]
MRLIQLSDLHLSADPEAGYRGVHARRHCEAVVADIRHQHPDLVLVTGDVSEDGSVASYRLAASCLDRLGCDWEWLPGNHDERTAMVQVRPLPERLVIEGWQLLLLDTLVPGDTGGRVGPAALERLSERLVADSRPTLIAMHHPPVPVNSAWMDAAGLADRDEFWQRLALFDQVRAVLAGHVHHVFETCHRQVSVETVPAVSRQFVAASAEFALDEAARPGYRVIELADSGALQSRVIRVNTA